MVFLTVAEQCGEQFGVICADHELELAEYPIEVEPDLAQIPGPAADATPWPAVSPHPASRFARYSG
jgi:hypothetical protein